MATILVPVAYLFVVFGGLYIFSYIYRKRAAAETIEPYFGVHHERNVYVTLLQQDPQPPEPVLKAALMRRAMTDVQRLMRIREDKPALQALLQKGCVGDDAQTSLNAAEQELSAEILEVVHEANSFVPNWGQFIFPSASELVANEKIKATYENNAVLREDLAVRYGIKAKPMAAVNVTLNAARPPPNVAFKMVNGKPVPVQLQPGQPIPPGVIPASAIPPGMLPPGMLPPGTPPPGAKLGLPTGSNSRPSSPAPASAPEAAPSS